MGNVANQGLDKGQQVLGAVGLGSDGMLGREVGAQLTEQMTELRGIRGFEEAEEMTDLLWDKSKELTIGGVGWLETVSHPHLILTIFT